jgi:hypothetical protein
MIVLPPSTLCDAEHSIVAAMQKYGQACRTAALEEAAVWLDFYDGENKRRAEHIRSLK